MRTRAASARRGFVGLLVAGMVAVSCSSGTTGSSPTSSGPTLQGYFDQLKKISEDADRQFRALQDDLNASLASAQSDDEALPILKDFLEKNLAQGERLVAGLEALDPPAEVEIAHNELIDAEKSIVNKTAVILAEYDGFTSLAQVHQRIQQGDLAQAGKRVDDACAAVQKVGDDNDINVDLSCGPDQPAA